jgi:hypothetical protein
MRVALKESAPAASKKLGTLRQMASSHFATRRRGVTMHAAIALGEKTLPSWRGSCFENQGNAGQFTTMIVAGADQKMPRGHR